MEKKKKEKEFVSIVPNKMCVFCLYPIPDSQQCVKRGSCKCLILSGLLCLFSFLGLGPICDEFRIWASNLVRFYFIKSLSRFCISYLFRVYFVFNCYLPLNVMFVFIRIIPFFRISLRRMSLYLFKFCFVFNCVSYF